MYTSSYDGQTYPLCKFEVLGVILEQGWVSLHNKDLINI